MARASYKTPVELPVALTPSVAERFWAKIDATNRATCWNWVAYRNADGYGKFGLNGKAVSAHRLSYTIHNGAIPDGLVVDHLCFNKSCVNPLHLEAITQRENMLRGDAVNALNVRKTHCPQGHPYDGDNLIINRLGARLCRECQRADGLKRYYARKQAVQKLAGGERH